MQRRHELIESSPMQRRMHLWCFGHFGEPVLVFPSAAGMAHEWDAHGMVEALTPLIDSGRIKLYCSESNVAEAWTGRHGDPAWRLSRHQAFESYVNEELAAFIRSDCRSADIRIATTGCSLGAFYACNAVLKNPEVFDWALCMSGRYDMRGFVEDHHGLDLYYNNPMAYVANLGGDALERARRAELILVCGQGRWEDGNIEETRRLAETLNGKGIRATLDLWGRDVDHSWAWWKRQALHHLGGRYGS